MSDVNIVSTTLPSSNLGGNKVKITASTPKFESNKLQQGSLKSIQDSGKEFSDVKKSSLSALDEVQATLDDMISEINKALSQRSVAAQIAMDKQIDRFVIKVTDKTTGELLREVPSEAIQRFARNIEQLKGVLFEAVL